MECPHAHVSVRLPPGCVCRRHVKKEACAFGVLSSSRPAALWPFLSPAAGEEGGLQQGSPPVPLSAGLCAGCHHHPRGCGGDPMLPAGQRSQLPGLQPAHSERSASGHPAWAAGSQLNQRSLTVREQSSRPRAGGCVGATWWDSHSVAGSREANTLPGAWGAVGCIPRLPGPLRNCPVGWLTCASSTWT